MFTFNHRFRKKIFLKLSMCFTVVLLGSWSFSAFAATYYVDPNAASDSGNGSSTSPKKYITSGIQMMSAGDTLILRDGTYTGSNNFIGDYASPQVYPPSGSAGNFTTIKAEHVGQAIIDGQYKSTPFSTGNHTTKCNYVHIDGIHFRHGTYGLFNIYGDHDWVSNCGFEDGMAASDNSETYIASMFGGSSYGLVEDCWVWGKGRYGFYTSSTDPFGNHTGTNHMIFRRVVVRMDDTPAGWMTAGLRFYGSDTNTMQNCIIIDGNWNPSSVEFHGMATGGGSSGSDSNDAFYGNIVLNNPLIDCYWSEKGTGTHTLANNVCWGNKQGPTMSQDFEAPFTVNLSHNTTGQNSVIDMRQNYSFNTNLTDELYFTKSGASTFLNGTITPLEYVYLASGASIGSGSSGYTSFTNATQSSLNNAGLKYLPRIESGSTLASAGVGANILYQIGATGSFYGDANWNATTTNPLWPLANEAIWAAKMKAYTASGPGGNRGFAAVNSTTPLTDYIWGYLGNAKPNIYGSSTADTTAPSVSISSPTANSSVSGTVSVTANATDNVGVSTVEFYVNGALQSTDTSTPYTFSWNTSSLSAGTYILTAKAYDAAGNVGQSGSVSVTLVKDTTAPTVSITSPANNASISGTATITASATDNVGVSKVEFYDNGALLYATNVSPFSYSWNTTTASNGGHTLSAKAYDATGNVGQSSNVAVTVNNTTSTSGTTAQADDPIWPATAVPGVVDSGPDNAVELGVKFRSDVSGNVTGIRFYKSSANTGTHVGNLWTSSGTLLATATFSNETASGWQQVNFSKPVLITANTVYVASYHTNAGHYSDDQQYFNGKGMDSAPLHALADGVSGSNGVYAYGSTSSFPSQSWNASNYWVDIAFVPNTTTADTTAPTAAISSPAANSTVSGTVTVSATATDNVGVTKVEFYVNGALKATDTAAPYSYSWGTTSTANGSYILSVKAYDAAGNVGTSSNVTVSVNNTTTTADTTAPTAAISSPAANSTVSGTVTVSASATDNVGVTKVEFYVNGALKATDTAAPYSYSWDTTAVSNGSYSLTVKAYDAAGNVGTCSSVSVSVNNVSATQTSSSIWSSSAIPGIADSGPDNAVELGVKFKSDTNGYITGIRFYKGSGNTGTHVANLWTSSGTLLASATFTSETSSGWQQVNFSKPVAITANTVYVASYHTDSGHYSDDQNFFASNGVDNAPLHALSNRSSGGNGVYAYGSSSNFPSKSWKSSNYWVDVVFHP